MKVTNEITVGLHPTALQWDEPRARLYVANSNSDSISVVNTQTHQVAQTIFLQPFARKVAGLPPTRWRLAPTGRRFTWLVGESTPSPSSARPTLTWKD